MSEMKTEEVSVSEETSQATKDDSQTNTIPPTSSREPLWGAFLFAFMLLFVVASITAIAWVMYSGWKNDRAAKAEPSITVLSQGANEEQKNTPEDTAQVNEADTVKQPAGQTSGDATVSAKKMVISVLNGGAAKGSAGTIATFFKTEGYANVTPGNTVNNYIGTVVYYAPSLEKEAEAIRVTLAKKYPQAKTLPVDVKNKETSASQITIILGK